jgi:hypothetical protein
MAKKPLLNQNASLPPTLVLSTFLLEQKRTFVASKLKEYGLVRKEYFDKSLGHNKNDFKLKKLFGKRYRLVTATLTDLEIHELFDTIQTLIVLKEDKTTLIQKTPSTNDTNSIHSNKPGFSLFNFIILLTTLSALGGAGYVAFTSYEANPEYAITIGAIAVSYGLLSLLIINLYRLIKRLR